MFPTHPARGDRVDCRTPPNADEETSPTLDFIRRENAQMTTSRGPEPAENFVLFDEPRFRERQRLVPATKVAWLCHLVDADDLVSLDPSFAEFSFAARDDYLACVAQRAVPVVMSAVDVRSTTGSTVRVYPILLPFTSRWIKQRLDDRRLEQPRALVQQGIDCAHSLGCQMVALGQYTSIVTCAGTRLAAHDMGITTGNSYAIALAMQAVEQAQRESGRDPLDAVLVIAGAAGNIGRTCAEILAPHYRQTILIGSNKPGSARRLRTLAGRIPNAIATTDLSAVGNGDVVIAAINAVDCPLVAERFAPNAIVCDLSVPASLQSSVAASRPDLLVIKGGIAALPFGEDLEIVDFPLPRGQTYGCMAEAMLLGFEGVRDSTFTGSLTPEHVSRVTRMAARHGFELAGYKRTCVLGSERREPSYAVAV
jgi:predicted amino acid dehydrogenase